MSPEPKIRNFFLNEAHQLTATPNKGGGGHAKFDGINWASRGRAISESISSVKKVLATKTDPVLERHFFLMAAPVAEIGKRSEPKDKPVKITKEKVDFGTNYHQNLGRLGFETLSIANDGKALVHITPLQLDALQSQVKDLAKIGSQEQARWAPVGAFSIPDAQSRVDTDWLNALREPTETVINFQPVLNSGEIRKLIEFLGGILNKSFPNFLISEGVDYSGRQWFKCKLAKDAIRNIAEQLFSIQSIHPPLYSLAVDATQKVSLPPETVNVQPTIISDVDPKTLPIVGVVDLGVEQNHALLGTYEAGRYIEPQSVLAVQGDHGSRVASRIVFGEVRNEKPHFRTSELCRYWDILVPKDAQHVEDKSILPALLHFVTNERQVRVFNLSFGDDLPPEMLQEITKNEKLLQMEQIDNLIFEHDIIAVVSAGNSRSGAQPTVAYPDHWKDASWGLPAIAKSANALVTGSYASITHPSGIAAHQYYPSPFTRLGPGMGGAPSPTLSESGGDMEVGMARGWGAWVSNRYGIWQSRAGTSYAAPLLARKAAKLMQALQNYCPDGGKPFGCLVRAFLHLTAQQPVALPESHLHLASVSLGRGTANADAFFSPTGEKCVFFWQGKIASKSTKVNLRIPIPKKWANEAKQPHLRIIWAWDSPVNHAAHGVYICREVELRIKMREGADALRPKKSKPANHPHSTLREKIIDLSTEALAKKKLKIDGDDWLFEFTYKETADLPPMAKLLSNEQRVGMVFELFDADETPVSPRQYVESLGIANTLNRLSLVAPIPIATRKG